MYKGQNFFGRLSTVYEIKEIFFMEPHHQHRAVAKISSCWVYVISGKGIVQLGISFGSISLLFPARVAQGLTLIVAGGNPWPLFLSDSRSCQQYMHMYTVLSHDLTV